MAMMSTGNVIFEKSGQAPSPSKDFHQLLVTDKMVIWRSWKISLRKEQMGIPPSQRRLTHEDFYDDDIMPAEIKRVFGDTTLIYVQGYLFNDWLVRMPDDILHMIFARVHLFDVGRLAQVCRHFRVICNSAQFWKALYIHNIAYVTEEEYQIGNTEGWKQMFFTHRLQVRKKVSQMRRSADEKHRPIVLDEAKTYRSLDEASVRE